MLDLLVKCHGRVLFAAPKHLFKFNFERGGEPLARVAYGR